jgi:hypothetical protein
VKRDSDEVEGDIGDGDVDCVEEGEEDEGEVFAVG